MKLYELTANYIQIQEMIEEQDSEMLRDTLESIEGAIEEKAENIAKMIQSFNGDIEVLKAEEKRLADRRKSIENKIAGMKHYLHEQLEFAGLKKVKSATFTIGIQNNPPSVEIADESLVPEDYLVPQAPKVDKKSILQLLKEGHEFEWASLKQGQSLRIR